MPNQNPGGGGGVSGLPATGPGGAAPQPSTPPAAPTPPAQPAAQPAPAPPAPVPPSAPPQPGTQPQPQPATPGPQPGQQPAPQRPAVLDDPRYKELRDKNARAMQMVAQRAPQLYQQIKTELGRSPQPAPPPGQPAPQSWPGQPPAQPRYPNGQFAPQPPPWPAAPAFAPADPLAGPPYPDPYGYGEQALTPAMVQQMMRAELQQMMQWQQQQEAARQQAEAQQQVQAEVSEVREELEKLNTLSDPATGQRVIPQEVLARAMKDTTPYLHSIDVPGGARRNLAMLLDRIEVLMFQSGTPEALATMRAEAEAAARQTTLAQQPAPAGGPGTALSEEQAKLDLYRRVAPSGPGKFLSGKAGT